MNVHSLVHGWLWDVRYDFVDWARVVELCGLLSIRLRPPLVKCVDPIQMPLRIYEHWQPGDWVTPRQFGRPVIYGSLKLHTPNRQTDIQRTFHPLKDIFTFNCHVWFTFTTRLANKNSCLHGWKLVSSRRFRDKEQ